MDIDFKSIVLKYKDIVYKTTYSGCGNIDDADDIIQEVFMTLYCQNKNFDSEEHLKAWLIRITINRVKSHMRSFRIRKRTSLDENFISAESPEDTAELKRIREAVMELPYKYRICVILHYYIGYSCEETAYILKSKEATVKTRLRRAREQLKKQLQEDLWYD